MRVTAVLCIALLLALASAATAQEFRATVKGQVVDSSQAALPGATVTVRNQETDEVAHRHVERRRQLHHPVPPSRLYTLTVEMSGFQKYTRNDMRLEVEPDRASINAQLGVGGVDRERQRLGRIAAARDEQRRTAARSSTRRRIAELPLQSRSPMALATLVAGVNYNAQAIYLRPFDNGALADWSMNGGQNRNNEFLLDGAPNNANQGGNNIAYVPPAEAVQEFKISTNSYDAQYGRTAGGVVNMSLKSGTNSFHGVGYDFMRRKGLAANSFLLNSRSTPKTDQYLDQYGFSVDGPDPVYNEQDVLPVHRREVPGGHARPAFSTVPTPAMKNGDFSGLVDASGQPDHHLRPGDRPRRQRRVDARSVPGQQHPGRSHLADRAGAVCSTSRTPTAPRPGVAPWQQNLHYTEHFNKDIFWNWVGKVDHNFSANDRVFFRWGENKRNEIRNTSAIRSGPAQDGQLPLWRANRALVGDWVHVFGAGTVFNLRGSYTYFLEWSYSTDALGFDATQFWPANLVKQLPSKQIGGIFPRIEFTTMATRVREPVARLGPEPEQDLHASAERVAEPRRAQHPQWSRHAVDQRLRRELQQFGRSRAVHPRTSRAAR